MKVSDTVVTDIRNKQSRKLFDLHDKVDRENIWIFVKNPVGQNVSVYWIAITRQLDAVFGGRDLGGWVR
jgi:hypothetical protein